MRPSGAERGRGAHGDPVPGTGRRRRGRLTHQEVPQAVSARAPTWRSTRNTWARLGQLMSVLSAVRVNDACFKAAAAAIPRPGRRGKNPPAPGPCRRRGWRVAPFDGPHVVRRFVLYKRAGGLRLGIQGIHGHPTAATPPRVEQVLAFRGLVGLGLHQDLPRDCSGLPTVSPAGVARRDRGRIPCTMPRAVRDDLRIWERNADADSAGRKPEAPPRAGSGRRGHRVTVVPERRHAGAVRGPGHRADISPQR